MKRERGPGRPSSFPADALKPVLVAHKNSIVVGPGKIAAKNDPVWRSIQDEFCDVKNVSTTYLYTIVLENRFDTDELLGRVQQDSVADEEEETQESNCLSPQELEGDTEQDSGSDSSGVGNGSLSFTIAMPEEEWKTISPELVAYKDKSRKSGYREYNVLRRRTWTHAINSHFWLHTRLPCRLRYQGGRVHMSGEAESYIAVKGVCTFCYSQFKGKIFGEPQNGSLVPMECTYKGPFETKHPPDLKRHLSGAARDKYVRRMINENITASAISRLDADSLMNLGDPVPSHLPSTNVLRVAKSEALRKTRIDDDPILAVAKAKYQVPFQGILRQVSYDPLNVKYYSAAQLHCYNQHCKDNEVSSLSIDATGGVVRKVKRSENVKSGSIFLYEGVVRNKVTHKIYPVTSMISESHNTETLRQWLAMWIRDRAAIPREVVVDMSLALMSACIQVFTPFPSLADYLDNCAKILDGDPLVQPTIPPCYVRNDVAHLVKLMTGWKSLKGQIKRTKQFYMRCLCQVLQSTSISDIKVLLEHIITVSLSETEGEDEETGLLTPCEVSKNYLLARIGGSDMSNLTSETDTESEDLTKTPPADKASTLKINAFSTWVQSIVDHVQRGMQCGLRGNQQFLPGLVDDILRIAPLIPLWTAVMVPFFRYGDITASSAPVECDFNDLKNSVFQHMHLPCRLDDFIFHHVKANQGAMKLAGSKSQKEQTEENIEFLLEEISDTVDNTADSKGRCADGSDYLPPASSASIQSPDNAPDKMNTEVNFHNGPSLTAPTDNTMKSGQCLEKAVIAPVKNHVEQEDQIFDIVMETAVDQDSTAPCKNLKECTDAPGGKTTATSNHDPCDFKTSAGEIALLPVCSILDSRRKEMDEVEDWGGLGKEAKRRNRSSYLEPNSEWLRVNLGIVKPVVPIGILRNGNSLNLKPIRIGKDKYVLENTCAFDALAQICCTAYCDSDLYKDFVDNTGSDFFLGALAADIVNHGITARTYKLRAQGLLPFYITHKLPGNITQVKCETPVAALIPFLLSNHPSSTERSKCDFSLCPDPLREVQRPFLTTHVQRAESVTALENLVLECLSQASSSCLNTTNSEEKTYCNGIRTRTSEVSNSHIFVEVVQNNPQRLLQCIMQLDQIPTSIIIQGSTYFLRGAVAFEGSESLSTIGHYVAYTRRHENSWEIYNDLHDKKEECAKNRKIVCHHLVYTV